MGGLGRTLCVLGSVGSGCQRPVGHWSTPKGGVAGASFDHRISISWLGLLPLTSHCIVDMIVVMWQVMVLVAA